MTTFVQHTTNPMWAEVFVMFFKDNDARHWVPSGDETINVVVDSVEYDEDPTATLEAAAERWCDHTHGKGSFWSIVTDDEF